MPMTAYEIHAFRDGRWKIDSMFDDQELAVFEAKRMDASGRFSGIRVVEEWYDEQSQRTSSRIIYRSSKVAEGNQQAIERSKENRREVAAAKVRHAQKEAVRVRTKAIEARKRQSNPYRLLMILGLIGGSGIALLIMLSHFSSN